MWPLTRGHIARCPCRNEIIYYQYFSPACFTSPFISRRQTSKVKDVYFERAFARFLTFQRSSARLSLSPFASTKELLVSSRKDRRSFAVFAVCGVPVCFVRIFALIYLHIRSPIPIVPFSQEPSSTYATPLRHRFSFLQHASDELRSSLTLSSPKCLCFC